MVNKFSKLDGTKLQNNNFSIIKFALLLFLGAGPMKRKDRIDDIVREMDLLKGMAGEGIFDTPYTKILSNKIR